MTLPWSNEARTGRLLRRARTGDREAFRALYRALYPRIWAFFGRRLQSRDECEELTARTFEKLLAQLGSWDGSRGSPLAFALAIARGLLLDELRARKQGVPLEEAELLELTTPHSLLERAEELEAVRAQLDRLEPALREMFALRFADGLSHREIGQLLNVSEAAVKQRFSRALRELRDRLNGGATGVNEETAR